MARPSVPARRQSDPAAIGGQAGQTHRRHRWRGVGRAIGGGGVRCRPRVPAFRPRKPYLCGMDLDGSWWLRAGHPVVPRRSLPGHDGRHHRGRFPHPPLRHRLHVGRRRLQPVLRVHEPVRLRHVDAGAGRQPAGPVPRLGRRRPLQLSADWLFPYRSRKRLRRAQGFRRHARRRHGDAAGSVPAVPGIRHHRHRRGHGGSASGLAGRIVHRDADRPAAARRCRRQVGAGAAADLAAGRHGRSDTGLRADSRGDDGYRGRVPHSAHPRPVPALPGGPVRGRLRGPGHIVHISLHGTRAARHQTCARLLDHESDRLHVLRARRRRLVSGGIPPDDPRVLQGTPVPRLRIGHPGAAPRAGHVQDGRSLAETSIGLLEHVDRLPGARGAAAHLGLLQQGRHPVDQLRVCVGRPVVLGRSGGRRLCHGPLYHSDDADYVLR